MSKNATVAGRGSVIPAVLLAAGLHLFGQNAPVPVDWRRVGNSLVDQGLAGLEIGRASCRERVYVLV